MDLKRKAMSGALVPVKRPRNELQTFNDRSSNGKLRSSNLQAPIMLLSGHEGEIFCTKFSPNGRVLASAGFDRLILLWSVYGDCDNIATMKGHRGAILELRFSTDGSQLVTCSTDKSVALWDAEVCERMRKFRGHQTFVNSCDIARRGPQMLCSGSDDGTIRLWDSRLKHSVKTLESKYQVTSVCFTDTSEQIISGGIDNDLKFWDLRQNAMLYSMRGHSDTVTGTELSPDGSYLLTTSMDNTVRIWDVRPFAPKERCVKIIQASQKSFEKNLLRCAWSPDGGMVAAGSGDRIVYIWNTTSRNCIYSLPGHAGSVNEVDFHPTEPIIASGSSDKRIFLGELDNN